MKVTCAFATFAGFALGTMLAACGSEPPAGAQFSIAACYYYYGPPGANIMESLTPR